MATRSTIAIEYANGTVGQVYCHWDGYLEHNGRILQDHYSNPFILRDLIDMGDISSLGKIIGTNHPFSPFESETAEFKALPQDEQERIKAATKAAYDLAQASGATTFYGRDRGETNIQAKTFKNFEDYVARHQYEEYEYILRNVDGQAVWFVAEHGNTYAPLAELLLTVEETV